MNLVLIILTGTLMGAFNFGFFLLGYYLGTKKESQDGITVTKDNKDFIKEMMAWRSYDG